VSTCGNFGYLGCASGQVDMFNMQSGIHRKTFGGADGHKKPITGLVTDSIHRYLITVSVDRTLKVFIKRLLLISNDFQVLMACLVVRFGKSKPPKL
jgi:hypothetical protein